MVDRYPRYIDITAELYSLKRIIENLRSYIDAQDRQFRDPVYKFIIDIHDDIRDLRFEMDESCLPLFGGKRYDEYLAQNTQIHHPKLDPLIELVRAAENDPIWRQRLAYFADRLEAVGNECFTLAGEVRPNIVIIVERWNKDLIPRLRKLTE